MRGTVVLLLFLGAAFQHACAASSFKYTLKRVKEEGGHIASSLQDKERMRAKLDAMRNDLADLYKMASAEAHRMAGPHLQAAQQSWAQFRARIQPATARAEAWLKQQHLRALELHLRATDALHGQLTTKLPQGQAVERKHVEVGLLAAYSGVAALLVSLLLRRAF